LLFEINTAGSCSFFATLNFLIHAKSIAKTTAEHGTGSTEEGINLLCKKTFYISQTRFYIELRLNNKGRKIPAFVV